MSIYNTNIGHEYNVNFTANAQYEALLDVTPVQAVVYVLTTVFMLSFAIGVIVFSINLTTGSAFGTIAGGLLVALNLFTIYFQNDVFFRLSPISWVELNSVKLLPFKLYPALVLGIITAAAITAALIKCRKKSDII